MSPATTWFRVIMETMAAWWCHLRVVASAKSAGRSGAWVGRGVGVGLLNSTLHCMALMMSSGGMDRQPAAATVSEYSIHSAKL